jgi:hypothetical protein
MVNTSSVIFHRVEEFEDTKRVIRIRKPKKERQQSDQKKTTKEQIKLKIELVVYFHCMFISNSKKNN